MSSITSQSVAPEAQIIQMGMGGWTSTIIAETSRHRVPDVLKEHGPLSAAEIVDVGGVDAAPDALERLLQAAAAVGILTEDAEGRFGLNELSEVLTSDCERSVKKLVGEIWNGDGVPPKDKLSRYRTPAEFGLRP